MLEVIAQSVEDAKAIESGGAGRIELVSGISVGGLTPSYGMIEKVVSAVKIPVNVMVRPHGYHFEYKPSDIEVMKRDIQLISELGVSGIVLGVLENQNIHEQALKDLISELDCHVTFHRAIDETDDVLEAYKKVCQHKVTQVLTSGGPGKAEDNMKVLDKLYAHMPDKLLIGSGITLNNIGALSERYPRANFHVGSDARVNQNYSNRIDEKHIRLIVDILK